MKDLKFEQKSSLSRIEAADRLTALAAALRDGGEAELELGPGTLSLRIPDDLRSEMEVEVGDGEIELEIEFKWSTAPARPTSSQASPKASSQASAKASAGAQKATRRKTAPAKPSRGGTGAGRGKSGR
ncbi:amphi-Trp domain-containing protein [Streptomyces sp. NPDC001668]|uniref:amphi-Trp domain-containing protein n=1 Tax=unclassified Streptomyces TaxID=2593676 RepID=UPI003406D9EB